MALAEPVVQCPCKSRRQAVRTYQKSSLQENIIKSIFCVHSVRIWYASAFCKGTNNKIPFTKYLNSSSSGDEHSWAMKLSRLLKNEKHNCMFLFDAIHGWVRTIYVFQLKLNPYYGKRAISNCILTYVCWQVCTYYLQLDLLSSNTYKAYILVPNVLEVFYSLYFTSCRRLYSQQHSCINSKTLLFFFWVRYWWFSRMWRCWSSNQLFNSTSYYTGISWSSSPSYQKLLQLWW